MLEAFVKTQKQRDVLGELLSDPNGHSLFKSCETVSVGSLYLYLSVDGIVYYKTDVGRCRFCAKDDIKRNGFIIPGQGTYAVHCRYCHAKADVVRKRRGLNTIEFRK